MQERNVVSDEPVDALYRACKRYEELYTKAKGNSAYDDALEHAFGVIAMYYMQREAAGDPLPALPRHIVDGWEFNTARAWDVVQWAGAIMNEIEERRHLRGRGTGQGAAVV